jgi:hypothetical protein
VLQILATRSTVPLRSQHIFGFAVIDTISSITIHQSRKRLKVQSLTHSAVGNDTLFFNCYFGIIALI